MLLLCYNIKYLKLEVGVKHVDLDAKTRLYMLLGNPVGHSLSPALHNAAFLALGMNCAYLAAPVEHDCVAHALNGIRALSIAGANVTSPYKETVIDYLDQVSADAQIIKSVNTIVNNKGRLSGYSTDGPGFYRALLESTGFYDPAQPVMIVGAGGAARALAYTMAQKIKGEIYIVNRSIEKAEMLAELLKSNTSVNQCHVVALESDDLIFATSKCPVIIYSLPVDSASFINSLRITRPHQEQRFLFDLRYSPRETEVMNAFNKVGGRSFNGIGMLFWQAVEAFELFTGEKAPIDIMKEALDD